MAQPQQRRLVKIIVSREPVVGLGEGESDLAVSVVPPRVRINQNDQVTWTLESRLAEGDECAASPYPKFRVSPKQPDWPFRTHPHTGDRDTDADSGRMNDNAAGSYKYNVTVICRGEFVAVDPDMDVME